MNPYVLGFRDIDRTELMIVGGKGANLGELSRIEGIRVPEGFCVSTEAFKRIVGETPSISALLDELSLLKAENRGKIAELSGEIRRVIEGIAIPEDISEEITRFLRPCFKCRKILFHRPPPLMLLRGIYPSGERADEGFPLAVLRAHPCGAILSAS